MVLVQNGKNISCQLLKVTNQPLSLENPLSPSYGSVYSLLKTDRKTHCLHTQKVGRRSAWIQMQQPHLQGGKPKLTGLLACIHHDASTASGILVHCCITSP